MAGGAESMSRGQYWLPGMRWGQRMGDGKVIDAVVGGLSDPFAACHMGVTAENVAEDYGISREDQDALAVESHRRAAAATAAHYFDEQITPIQVTVKKKTVEIVKDEHFREDVSLESMARLRPAFAKEGTVTAGNASGMNDAAAAVVLASSAYASSHGLQPMARLVGYSHRGRRAQDHGHGPGAGRQDGAGEDRPETRRDRRVRGERGLRGPGPRRHPRTRPARGPHQPQRQRHLAGAPGRRHRRHPDRQDTVRAEAHRWPVRRW